MRSACKVLSGLRLSVLIGMVVAAAAGADAATIINTGIVVGGSFSSVTSVSFGDARGAIPMGSMVATSAIPTTDGGPGIVPELGLSATSSRLVLGPNTITQAQALNITGDASLATLYQFIPPSPAASRSLNLYFATPILTGTLADVWLGIWPGTGGAGWQNIVTFAGIDMNGNLVDSVLATVLPQTNAGLSGTAPGSYRLDVDGNPSNYTSTTINVTSSSYGINFNAGQTLKGIQLSWNSTTGGQRIAEVWGINPVPEPGTLELIAAPLLGFLAYAWRKRRRG